MHERNFYKELEMEHYLWGDVFLLSIDEYAIDTKKAIVSLLDEQCKRKGLNSLGEKCNEIDLITGKSLLRKMLQYDLAYPSAQIMPEAKVEFIYQALLYPFLDKLLYCYTNWKGNPWDVEEGASWNPLTTHTFDFSIILINHQKMLFAYSISED